MNAQKMQEQLINLSEHIANHPHDYQSVIALYKLRSKAIERERFEQSIEKRRMIAKCKQVLKGERHEEP